MRTVKKQDRRWLLVVLTMWMTCWVAGEPASTFTPGSVYREYRINPGSIKDGWRVTSPSATHEGARAFLPNPVLSVDGVELKDALSAEMEIDFWSGHHGTRGKQVRINDSGWINLQERLAGTRGYAGDYLAEYNIRMSVPLGLLREGTNTIEGTSRNNAWGWGQWGWYSITLRVFYDPEKVEHPAVEISSVEGREGTRELPWTFGDHPTFHFTTEGSAGIRQIDLLGGYEGVDENGDGLYGDLHGMQRLDGLEGHIGTVTGEPWKITWDTTWVPDQEAGAIRLLPRVCDRNGIWTVGEAIEGATLVRTGHSVKLLKSLTQPVLFWVRAGQMDSCVVEIKDKEIPLEQISEAMMYLRGWNVENNEEGYTPFRVNCSPWMDHVTGPSHAYHAAFYDIPVEYLQSGHNMLTFTSSTQHHGCEFLWPGPDVLIRIEKPVEQ